MVTQLFRSRSAQSTQRRLQSHLLVTLQRLVLHPRRSVAELRTLDTSNYTVGQEIGATVFAAGELVDATGTSTGKGTAGVMKRHGFGGLGSSHGVDRKHRMPGSIGACSTPGRVFKGMRMSGVMGGVRVTTQNLVVHSVDADRNLLLIKGSVPGPDGQLVFIRSAAKHAIYETAGKAGN
jgi:large subunit ribosomal protein L3